MALIAHNVALRDNLPAVLAMKEAIAAKDYAEVAMYLKELGEEVSTPLWVAPTAGGIFTTEERTFFKSDEFGAARRQYLNPRGENK